MAESKGCHQCLWLLGEDDEITEVGAMNIFVLMKKENSSDLELVTPPLESGVILPGITRKSVIELTKEWNEFDVNERKLTMGEVNNMLITCMMYIRVLQILFFFLIHNQT